MKFKSKTQSWMANSLHDNQELKTKTPKLNQGAFNLVICWTNYCKWFKLPQFQNSQQGWQTKNCHLTLKSTNQIQALRKSYFFQIYFLLMLLCLCSSGSTVLRYNIKHVHLGTDVSTFTQNDVISHVPEYLILSSKYSWYRIWKEFYLSRNPRNGGDVLAKDVDGHQGGELCKKACHRRRRKFWRG